MPPERKTMHSQKATPFTSSLVVPCKPPHPHKDEKQKHRLEEGFCGGCYGGVYAVVAVADAGPRQHNVFTQYRKAFKLAY
jgi:hypothetical protein